MPARTTSSIVLHAGPGNDFPTLDKIGAHRTLDLHGCVKGGTWCDVSYRHDRGWVRASSLQSRHGNGYVALRDTRSLPTVTFSLGSYWDHNYRHRDFYQHRDRYSKMGMAGPSSGRGSGLEMKMEKNHGSGNQVPMHKG